MSPTCTKPIVPRLFRSTSAHQTSGAGVGSVTSPGRGLMHYRACLNEFGVRRKLRAAKDLNGRTVKGTDGVQGTSNTVTIGRVETNW